MLYLVLLLSVLHSVAKADESHGEGIAMTLDEHSPEPSPGEGPTAVLPSLCCSTSDLREKLFQMGEEQREVASTQAEVIRILRAMKDHGAQQLADLQNLAKHQNLLLENHQALLLQVSQIASQMQHLSTKLFPSRQSLAPPAHDTDY